MVKLACIFSANYLKNFIHEIILIVGRSVASPGLFCNLSFEPDRSVLFNYSKLQKKIKLTYEMVSSVLYVYQVARSS